MLSGDNGILQKATVAKTRTERQSIVEQARTDVLGYQAENKGGDLDKAQLKSVLDIYFKDVPDLTDMSDTEIKEKQLETQLKYGTHTITVSEIYNGNLKGSTPPVTGNLNDDEVAGLPSGVVEIAKEDINNTTIKNNHNVRAVITGEVPIPNGFYYVGGTKDEGVVISDNVADSGKGTSHTVAQTLQGNQFVWVPVPNATDFKTYEGYSNDGVKESYLASCSEPFISEYDNDAEEELFGYDNEENEYNLMYNSVTSSKGFYVARYEASQGSNSAESKQGKEVWNNIPWGTSISDIGTSGAVYKSQQMYTDKAKYGVTSTLIYAVEWDAIMSWIDPNYKTGNCDTSSSFVANSTGKGYYEQSIYTMTGSNENYAVNNIYDLAGNVREWTMEKYVSINRTCRGGDFAFSGSNATASCRSDGSPGNGNDFTGFRIALYL